jgi:hypothetical protein
MEELWSLDDDSLNSLKCAKTLATRCCVPAASGPVTVSLPCSLMQADLWTHISLQMAEGGRQPARGFRL